MGPNLMKFDDFWSKQLQQISFGVSNFLVEEKGLRLLWASEPRPTLIFMFFCQNLMNLFKQLQLED